MEELTTILSEIENEEDADAFTSSDSIQDSTTSGQDAGQEDFSSDFSADAVPPSTSETQESAAEKTDSPVLSEQEKEELKNEIQEELNVDAEVQEEDSDIHTLDDVYTLLSDYMEKQETYQKEVKEYHDLYAEQSKKYAVCCICPCSYPRLCIWCTACPCRLEKDVNQSKRLD